MSDKSIKFDKIEEWIYDKKYFKNRIIKMGGFSMIISGSRESGKSYLLKNLLNQGLKNNFDFIIVFSKTLVNGFYESFLDTKLLFGEFDENVITKLKIVNELSKEKNKRVRFLIILDDMVNQKSRYNDKIEELYTMGRHYNFTTIILTQKLCNVGTAVLSNTGIFFTLYCGSTNERKYISENILCDLMPGRSQLKNINKTAGEAYELHLSTCVDYNSLVLFPYDQKIFKYRC